MNYKKIMLSILIIILTIGFATVSVNLVLSGKTSVAFDKEKLQVIFKRVRLNNEESENIIITDEGKSFVYIADDLTNVGDIANIEYDIKNESSNYDASIVVSCTTDNGENIEYTGNTINQLIEIKANDGYTDTLTTKLTKENNTSNSLALKCTLIVNPLERDTIMLGKEYNITFDANGGSVIDANVIVSYYEKYGELPVPTKVNNEFLGWYTEDGEKIDSNSLVKIKDNHTLIAKWKEICSVEDTWDFDYTGGEQTFTVPCDGEYKIELWGASGADFNNPGYGGYTMGVIELHKNSKLYAYIGEQGTSKKSTISYGKYGFNGSVGGNYTCNGAYNFYSGGATDIRLINGNWDNFNSLKSRIMVAASGASGNQDEAGANAGGLIGYSGKSGTGGTQTSGGEIKKGKFGYGAIPNYNANVCHNSILSGAGSGYYGGGNSTATGVSIGMYSAGGGSSFISGHNGCDAIKEESTSTNIIHTGQPNHYSGYIFTNTKMIDGAGYAWTNVKGSQEKMPNPSGEYYNLGVGHSGNGYARITLVSIK